MTTVFRLAVIIGLLHRADGILCYTCGATGGKGECISGYNTFITVYRHVINNNTKHVNDAGSRYPGYIDCDTFPEQTVCMIEEVRGSKTGKILSYTRGCSDGETFSFNLPNLKGLSPSNTTTCGFDTRGYRPCVTLCNSGDFCNGPSGATRSHLSLAMSVICLVVLRLLCIYGD